MASTPFSTLCHFHKPTLRVLASDRFSFGGGSAIAFGKVRKSRKIGTIPVCRAGSPVVFRDLDADDFRHPLDKQNTLILRAIPGLNELGRALLGTVAEQVMLLENIGTSVLVSKNQGFVVIHCYYMQKDEITVLTQL